MKIEVTEQEKNELKEIINLLQTKYDSETFKLGRNLVLSLKERFKGYYIYYMWNSFNGSGPIALDLKNILPNQLYAVFDFDYIIDQMEYDWRFYNRDHVLIHFKYFVKFILEENNHFVRKNVC